MEYRNELVPFLSKKNLSFDSLKSELLVTSNNIDYKCNKCIGVLLVYSDNCGHCIHFKPEYVKLYNLVSDYNNKERKLNDKKKEIKIFIMDANNNLNNDFLFKHNIRGVPSIFFISPPTKYTPYENSRNADTIWKELKKLI